MKSSPLRNPCSSLCEGCYKCAEPVEIGGLLISGGIWISSEGAEDADDYGEGEAHDALHPWHFAGCADCDERADAKEANRT